MGLLYRTPGIVFGFKLLSSVKNKVDIIDGWPFSSGCDEVIQFFLVACIKAVRCFTPKGPYEDLR